MPMASYIVRAVIYPYRMGRKTDRTVWGWGGRFRAMIEAKDMTLGQVADRFGKSESGLRNWVNGSREINLSDFVKLCASARLDPVMVLIEGTECSEFHDIARAWALSKDKPVERGALLLAARGILAGDDSRAANGAADARGTKPRRRL